MLCIVRDRIPSFGVNLFNRNKGRKLISLTWTSCKGSCLVNACFHFSLRNVTSSQSGTFQCCKQSFPKPKMSLPPCATLIALTAQLSPIGTNGQFTWADGKQACCRLSGHEGFLKGCKYPFWMVFPGSWRCWSLPLWSWGCSYTAEWGMSKSLGGMSYLCLPHTLLAQQFLQGKRAGNSALVLELHLQWVISVLGWDSLCSTPSSRLFRNLCSVSLGEGAVQESCSLSKQCDFSSLLAKALQCSFAFNHLVLLDKWLLRIFPQNLRKCSASHDCRISVKCPQEGVGHPMKFIII